MLQVGAQNKTPIRCKSMVGVFALCGLLWLQSSMLLSLLRVLTESELIGIIHVKIVPK